MSHPAEYLRVLDRAATPRPWKVHYYSDDYLSIGGQEVPDPQKRRESAEAIVALRTLLPALADVVEAIGAWRDDGLPAAIEKLRLRGDRFESVAIQAIIDAYARLAAAVAAVEGGQ